MPDVMYELLQEKKKTKRREKEMLGWAFPAPPAQVSIRLIFDFSFKMQPAQPGHTPGCSASTQPPQFTLLTAGASIFCQKSSWPNLAAVSTSLFICGAGGGRRRSGEGVEGSPSLG